MPRVLLDRLRGCVLQIPPNRFQLGGHLDAVRFSLRRSDSKIPPDAFGAHERQRQRHRGGGKPQRADREADGGGVHVDASFFGAV